MSRISTLLFFPFLQKIIPSFSPIRGLKESEDDVWQSTDNDPQFLLTSPLFKYLSGWISVRVKIDSESTMIPKLYFDFGEDYSEESVLYISFINLFLL